MERISLVLPRGEEERQWSNKTTGASGSLNVKLLFAPRPRPHRRRRRRLLRPFGAAWLRSLLTLSPPFSHSLHRNEEKKDPLRSRSIRESPLVEISVRVDYLSSLRGFSLACCIPGISRSPFSLSLSRFPSARYTGVEGVITIIVHMSRYSCDHSLQDYS